MYELKTLLPKMEIDLPTCMYNLKPTALNCDGPQCSSACSSSEKSSEALTIEARQDKLIRQLQDLKGQLAGIRSSLNLSAVSSQNMFVGNQLKEEPLHELVINAHPNFIPYALLATKNAWKDLFNINVKAYSHSTIPQINKEAEIFQKNIQTESKNPSLPTLNVSLIWKNCEHTEMISSPTMYVPIYGEVNIVRYLGRVGPTEYRYENSPVCNEIDAVLDICYQLLRCTTNKARVPLIRTLNNYLQKNEYFGGSSISVADIAVTSTLKRVPQITSKDLSNELNQWHARVQKVTLI